MIKLQYENNLLTQEALSTLEAVILTATNELDVPENLSWNLWSPDNSLGKTKLYASSPTMDVTTDIINHKDESFLELQHVTIKKQNTRTVNYSITPLSEIEIQIKKEDIYNHHPQKRTTQQQLATYNNFIKEMYNDDPDYDIELHTPPKTFFSKLELDYYLENLAVSLEESILLWMESTGKLSVNMNDDSINMPLLLDKSIKRVYMSGPARNKINVELLNGSTKDFHSITPSIQLEITNEILSILPEI